MNRVLATGGAVGGVLAAVGAWNLYQRATTETVPYTVVETIGDVEVRQYPETALVETTAHSESAAFRRLFRYIAGDNESAADVAMTAPVEVDGGGTERSVATTTPVEVEKDDRGESVAMTAPVETAERDEGVRMGFYLPATYDVDTAPRPTDSRVDLSAVPERTLAVLRFSWWATDGRVARRMDELLDTLDDADVSVTGDPFFMGYDAPWSVPFVRRNEVAVELAADAGT
ncbi:SOUL family heme-binding protein [Halomarina oriensis]|uniref:Heme-binding protein n=1 Tax=Halomarina oriensis TaxID=671145 RepID=A0A6B0GN85_9EURY|nr:heme-binding protein [Halomarina oriensis]MWG36332.1 heme-binding protein [Halomarina oriensis]